DRFAYVPLIGVFVALIWGVTEALKSRYVPASVLGATGALGCGACLVLSSHQLGIWRDSLTLFEHAAEVNQNTFIAHYSIGNALAERGKLKEAMKQWEEAARLAPNIPDIKSRMAAALASEGDAAGAVAKYQEALKVDANEAGALNNLAWL